MATLLVHLRHAPAAGLADVGATLTATLARADWWLWLVASSVLLALLAGWLTVRSAPTLAAAIYAGATIPLAAPLLEPWTWRCAAPELGLVGLGVVIAVGFAGGVGERLASGERSARRDALVVAAAAGLLGLALLTGWPEAGGDEPHYLLTARSLAVEGDLDLAADYEAGLYEPWWPGPLAPHTKAGRDPATRYSTHGFGLPALIAPAVAAGGERGGELLARMLMVLVYSTFAATLFLTTHAVADARAAWLGCALSLPLAPLLFAAPALFPETPAMLLAALAFLLLREPRSRGAALIGGLALAALPWIAMKLIPLAGVLAFAAVARRSRIGRGRVALAVGAPLAASAIAHGLVTWRLYGSLSPAAIYVGSDPAAGRHTSFGTDWISYLADWTGALAAGIGHLIDQKEGLLALGPHYLLAAAGVVWLWRERRFDLATLAAAWLAHAAPYALAQEIGGQSIPVRPLLPVVWTLAIALGVGLSRPIGRRLAAVAGALVALSVGITANLIAHPGLLSHDYSVRMSRTLLALSPSGVDLWSAFPRWLNVDDPWRVASLAWLVATGLLIVWIAREASRARREPDRPAERRAAAGGFVVTIAAIAALSLAAGAFPLSDAHLGGAQTDGVVAWVPQYYPETAWAEEGAVWVRPGAAREFVLESPGKLAQMRLALRTLTPTRVRLAIGPTRRVLEIEPDTPARIDVDPGDGRERDGHWYYLVRLEADDGLRPGAAGGGDYRLLGVGLRLVRARVVADR